LGLTVLYLQYAYNEASPKAISERTSYLQVRLESHRYQQFILAFYNKHSFGTTVSFKSPS
ncbi:hypothetical protein, partial [Leuconostoc mesenteroides]|uniref:hypothetical protein n=1 Tax=Leuconostoc mesenteroides TaxID=1245 RepID=UPI0023620EFE